MAARKILIVGNAIVDILTRIDDQFLVKHQLTKGAMHLVDLPVLKQIYQEIGQTVEMSGGSAANSAAAYASLGGEVAFVGSVADDGFGKIFRHDLKALNVDFIGSNLIYESEGQKETGRSLILTTSDSERSMLTYLGAAQKITKAHLPKKLIDEIKLFYIEGYLWDSDCAREALLEAVCYANKAGRAVAFSLSDAYCVTRHREEFRQLIAEKKIQIIFANGSELLALYPELGQNAQQAREALQKEIGLFACITNGKEGSYLITPEILEKIPPYPEKKKVIDTTGAGDLYAAGVLYGYVHGFTLQESAALGSFCGSLIVQQMGTRYLGSLAQQAKEHGFSL